MLLLFCPPFSASVSGVEEIVCVCVHVYLFACERACVCVCVRVYLFACALVRVYARVHARMRVCVCVIRSIITALTTVGA